MILEMEDADIVLDLRHLNTGRKSQYNAFWSECKKFLDESVGRAVDDRRHGEVTHLAMAISVRDLRDQVQAKCPGGTPIPSESWIRLQFWPKTQHAKSSGTLHRKTRCSIYGTSETVPQDTPRCPLRRSTVSISKGTCRAI